MYPWRSQALRGSRGSAVVSAILLAAQAAGWVQDARIDDG